MEEAEEEKEAGGEWEPGGEVEETGGEVEEAGGEEVGEVEVTGEKAGKEMKGQEKLVRHDLIAK